MTRRKHDPDAPFAQQAKALMRELRVLCRGLTEKEREDIGVNSVLMGICFAELAHPDTDKVRCVNRIGALQHCLRILVRKLLRRWKPTEASNKELRKQSIADLDRILKPPKKQTEPEPAPRPAPATGVCENTDCRNTTCHRHADRWN